MYSIAEALVSAAQPSRPPSPDPLPAEVTEQFDMLLGMLLWVICALAVGRLVWIGAEMGGARSHPSADPPDTPFGVFAGMFLASASSGIAGYLLIF